jgi:hypothetical protein
MSRSHVRKAVVSNDMARQAVSVQGFVPTESLYPYHCDDGSHVWWVELLRFLIFANNNLTSERDPD